MVGQSLLPGLLVSVRSSDEASEALAGGADVIDVKEPARGPLGAATADVVAQVVAAVDGRVPVSAALGEWVEWMDRAVPHGVAYWKWGLANLNGGAHAALTALRNWTRSGQPVAVAYADFQRAVSPEPATVADLACRLRFPAFLIDTAVKDGTTLLDWIPLPALIEIRSRIAAAGIRMAVAGSLGVEQIAVLRHLAPDWFAVRGAACEGGRTGRVSASRVRAVCRAIAEG